MIRNAVIALGLMASACSQAAPDPATGDGFAVTLSVKPSEDQGVHRIELPPVAVAALQRDDAGDVRIYDRDGRPLSLALADTASRAEGQRSVPLEAMPIAMPKPGKKAAVTVRVDQETQSVTVDAADQEAEAESLPTAALLFDTRRLDDPVLALDLEATLPKGLLVEVSVAASGDLKSCPPCPARPCCPAAPTI